MSVKHSFAAWWVSMGNSWHKCCDKMRSDGLSNFPYEKWENAPVFLMDDDITEAQEKLDLIFASWKEIVKANLFYLPFDIFIIEERMLGDNTLEHQSNFFFVEKIKCLDDVDGYQVSNIAYSRKLDTWMMLYFNMGFSYPRYNLIQDSVEMMHSAPSYVAQQFENLPKHDLSDPVRRIIGELVVKLSTRGMERDVEIAPEKLNKKRIRNGKTPISDTIYIRPKHYYTFSGEKISIDEKNPVRVHWRRGHIRGVRYGQGRSLIKQKYIAPCLVNFIEGDELPAHKTRVLSQCS